MKNRIVHIILMVLLVSTAFAQTEMQTIDSLKQAIASQSGREKVKTMLELSRVFYDVSSDDCISVGEAAIAESKKLKAKSLEAESCYKLGVRYMYHYDLDLSRSELQKALQMIPEDEFKKIDGFPFNKHFLSSSSTLCLLKVVRSMSLHSLIVSL